MVETLRVKGLVEFFILDFEVYRHLGLAIGHFGLKAFDAADKWSTNEGAEILGVG